MTDRPDAVSEERRFECANGHHWTAAPSPRMRCCTCGTITLKEAARQEDPLVWEVERLKKALAFYADEGNWVNAQSREFGPLPANDDGGERARAALEGGETDG